MRYKFTNIFLSKVGIAFLFLLLSIEAHSGGDSRERGDKVMSIQYSNLGCKLECPSEMAFYEDGYTVVIDKGRKLSEAYLEKSEVVALESLISKDILKSIPKGGGCTGPMVDLAEKIFVFYFDGFILFYPECEYLLDSKQEPLKTINEFSIKYHKHDLFAQ